MSILNIKCGDIMTCIEEFAPTYLAEAWDNIGLNLGCPEQKVNGILLCLDVTLDAVDEAIRVGADMIVSHHPMIFTPIKRIDTSDVQGSILKKLIYNGISVYCAHTNVDKTEGGLNDLLLSLLGLAPAGIGGGFDDSATKGYGRASGTVNETGESGNNGNIVDSGVQRRKNADAKSYRIGCLPPELELGIDEFCTYVSSRLKLTDISRTRRCMIDAGNGKTVRKVAVMCGSFDIDAYLLKNENVDFVVSGEMKHHQMIMLNDMGICAVIAGHHGTERYFVNLADKWIKDRYPDIQTHQYGFEYPPSI